MSICYVFGPAHQEVNKILHILSHHLEKPSFVMTHSNHDNRAFIKTIDGNNQHKRTIELQPHSHEFIDFFAGLLKTSGCDNTPANTNQVDQKIDKYIKSDEISSKSRAILFLLEKKSNYAEIKQKPFKGYFEFKKQPPRLV